jgi:phospholipid/cholesterol/gamma-HCH transport system substrate-binding protein
MDRKIANNLMVGIVVAAGVAAFTFLLFNLGGGSGLFSRQYTLYTRFRQVKGLHGGSEVSLAGLRIGNVRAIDIAKDDPSSFVVTMGIYWEFRDRVRRDTVARLQTQGLLGDKYIELSLGSVAEKALEAGDTVASEEPEDFFSKGGSIVGDLKRYFDKGGDVEKLLQNLTKLSHNLVLLTNDVRREKGILNELIYGNSGPELAAATKSLSGILRKINEGHGSLGGLVNDPSVYEDLKALMGGAKRSAILRYFLKGWVDDGAATAPKADRQAPKRNDDGNGNSGVSRR